MPFFSALVKSSRRASSRVQNKEENRRRNGNSCAVPQTNKQEKAQRRRSVRDFCNRVLKKDHGAQLHSSQRPLDNSTILPALGTQRQKSDPNKPLPPAPRENYVETKEQEAKRPVKNMERIMPTLSSADLQKLFSGAPQFTLRADEGYRGAPYPTVTFVGDDKEQMRKLTDHGPVRYKEWNSVTLATKQDNVEKNKYTPRCRERPNMLSMQGLERGTMGFTAALEIGVADSLKEDEQGFADNLFERRNTFWIKNQSLRRMSDEILGNGLIAASKAYYEKREANKVQWYSDLFAKFIFPPDQYHNKFIGHYDPHGLLLQAKTIIGLLSVPGIWLDFGLVEWRIRLGQILWYPPLDSSKVDTVEVYGEVSGLVNTNYERKYWLLAQILLSCELLLRLDVLKEEQAYGFDIPEAVEWSLVLARQWLENVKLEWNGPGVALDNLHYEGRSQKERVGCLLDFARVLDWPQIEEFTAKIKENNYRIVESTYSTPYGGTPLSTRSTSYFGNQRPEFQRTSSKAQSIFSELHPEGWLSNTYLSGLTLPGEGLAHFLISTTIENDELAISRLGRNASLYGGFKYSTRSFWSKECILGRVLAAGKDARECMGWVSSPITSKAMMEEWVDIEVDFVLTQDKRPRVLQDKAVELDGNVIGGTEISSVLSGDFVLPSEEASTTEAITVEFESLDLKLAIEPDFPSDSSEESKIETYHSFMNFAVVTLGGKQKTVELQLKYHVHFVTAFPCISSKHTELLQPRHSPTYIQNPVTPSRDFRGHPLHKAFTYTTTSLLSLLDPRNCPLFADVIGASSASPLSTQRSIPSIVIIDCMDVTYTGFPARPAPSPSLGDASDGEGFGSDLEMLVRAVCAERGWNAVISRRGRSCLACSVREAAALGWRVVVRLG